MDALAMKEIAKVLLVLILVRLVMIALEIVAV